jgi:hypothetical protein
MLRPANSAVLPGWYRFVSAAAFLLSGATILVGLFLLIDNPLSVPDWQAVATATGIYIVSQGLRALRLAIIVGDPGKSLRQLIQAHLVGAAASFALPYKLGDLLRMMELAFVLKRPGSYGLWRSILVMWIERVYDALPIAALLLFLGATIDAATFRFVMPILGALTTFIVVTFFTFFVLPENLDGLTLFLARRYHGQRVVAVLRLIDRIYRLTADARRMLHRKHVTLISISALIWVAEMAIVGRIFGEGELGSSATGLLRFLSGILSPNSSSQFGNLTLYSATIGLPLLSLGLIAWIGAARNGRLSDARRPRAFERPAALRSQ